MIFVQMENIKDRATMMGYDVWIAPRSSLVLQVDSSCGNNLNDDSLTTAQQLRHYDWNPPELWSRSAQVSCFTLVLVVNLGSLLADSVARHLQEHNWERWRRKLTLIQKSEVPAVVLGSTVGFQLGAGTEHELMSHAVVDHIARWRERTSAHTVSSARAVMAACKVASIDAEDDGRLP